MAYLSNGVFSCQGDTGKLPPGMPYQEGDCITAVLNHTSGADPEVVFLVNGELAGRVLVPPPLRRCKLSLAVQPYMGGVALLCERRDAAPESDSRSS